MAEESPAYPLIEAAIKRSPLSRAWTITIFAGGLLSLLILFAAIDGVLTILLKWNELRYVLFFISFITFVLVVYPFMMRLREKAILAFKPLLSLEEDAFKQVVADISKPNRRWEWTAVFLGISIFLFGLIQPWTLDWVSGYFWLTFYFVFALTILYGLVGWFIYDTLIGIIRVSRLSRQDLKLDILNTEMLAPVARWSLGISLVFVGVLSLSIITKWEIMLEWQTITGYVIWICFTLLIFFLSMRSAHRAMSEAKKRKLNLVQKHLADTSRELEERVAQGQMGGISELSATITALVTYEKRVKEVSTWPFNAGIIRRLAMSVVMPAAIYLIKIIGSFWARFGF